MVSQIIHGDCIDVMRTLPDNSVDAIVTDPPYGLGFMGKAWDALPPGLEWAEECLRVLKPGGHLLAFGGTRTWHRLAVAVEDAGFEIRDSIAWMYGSGFPKHRAALKPAFEPIVMARKPFKGSLAVNEAIHGTGALNVDATRIEGEASRPTGLKKDGSRSQQVSEGWDRPWKQDERANRIVGDGAQATSQGRWPANVVLDAAIAVVLDGQSGITKSGGRKWAVGDDVGGNWRKTEGRTDPQVKASPYEMGPSEGGASRFFYVAKAPRKERPVVDGVAHPTVKPLALMRWLVKLVTPAGGTVLEPFAGSGATVEACILEGFNYIAIEREAEYLPLIQARIERQGTAA